MHGGIGNELSKEQEKLENSTVICSNQKRCIRLSQPRHSFKASSD